MSPKHLHLLSPTAHPPPLDLAIHIVFESDPALRAVRPLVRIPVWDWLALEFSRHHRAHGIVARPLVGPVGQVEDLLVQSGGFLCGRRACLSFFRLISSGRRERAVMRGQRMCTNRRSSYACRRAGACEIDETYDNRAPMTAASSMAIATFCAQNR